MTRREQKYVRAVKRNTKGLEAVSSGPCPGCEQCAEDNDMTLEEYNAAYENGDIIDEGGFSWRSCGICGCHLGGNRYSYHWIDSDGVIMHDSDMCDDCRLYLANGDLPSNESLEWID